MNNIQKIAKRIFDIVISAITLVVFSPLFLYCYLMVRKEDGGTAIFSQERIGLHGKPFFIYKFRSMKMNAEEDEPLLFSQENDERLTRIGKTLREHHLDELPQLWNVLRGDMSFVGPRPERKFYIDQIMEHNPDYVKLYQIRPGVTSYATLYNGYTDTMEKRLRRLDFDLYYLEHQSLWTDIKILVTTFFHIVFGKRF